MGVLAPGDVIVHHCNAIHSADANESVRRGRRRRFLPAPPAGSFLECGFEAVTRCCSSLRILIGH